VCSSDLMDGETPWAFGKTIDYWSCQRGFPIKHLYLTVTVQSHWLKNVASIPGLATARRMLTTHAIPVRADVWKASWVERNSWSYELKVMSGYIMRINGRYYHGETEAGALNMRQQELEYFVDQVDKGMPVEEGSFTWFPELVDIANQQRTRFSLERRLQAGDIVEPCELMDFPDLLVNYGI
jgi:hypothetical protein